VHTVLTIRQRGDKVFGTTVEVYDLNGKLTESLSNNAGIEIHSGSMVRMGGKSTFAYDERGNLVRQNQFAPDGQYAGSETYVYDGQNRLIENIIYFRDGKEFERKSYKYLPGKLELEMTRTIDFGKGEKHAAKYLVAFNDKGQRTKWTEYDSKGALNPDFISFEYDAEGNVAKEEHCCKYNYSYRYSYKLDKHGNWIEQQTTYVQPDDRDRTNPDWMHTYRIITYYSDSQTKQ
jgi:hypothetical protein